MEATTRSALRRRMLRIDNDMSAASMMRGADSPAAVAAWSRAQDSMGAAERAIDAGDTRGASDALDNARDAMRHHGSILRMLAKLASAGGVR